MAVTGIGEQMIQYGKASEAIYNHKPKHSKKHGIKMPDQRNIIAVFAGIFVVVVIISQLM